MKTYCSLGPHLAGPNQNMGGVAHDGWVAATGGI
jgi:hypothetical protein